MFEKPVNQIFVATKTEHKMTFSSNYYYDVFMIARWESNDQPVPMDAAKSYQIDIRPEMQKRAIELAAKEAIAAYRKSRKQNGYSAEELGEMRAAFGAGETVVDMFTGQKIRL
jgi:hypothetical protein